jgi:8-amino-7-oxononanoate synthase
VAAAVLDFTSALYLGLRHPSHALRPWTQLTTGWPVALESTTGVEDVERKLASLVGCERVLLAPSTLHAFWDLLGVLSQTPVAIYLDAGSYPIARWGVERAALRGARVRRFPAHDTAALRALLQRDAVLGLRPIVVADGLCPGSGRVVPVAGYLEAVRHFDGYLVMDDTQALGILGEGATPAIPYGLGGGGTLRRSGSECTHAIVVNSLAKGFGVPVAMLGSSAGVIRRFEQFSETRTHCSPPSAAVVNAAAHALAVNAAQGDALRQRLHRLVRRFRNGLRDAGLHTTGGEFPVQILRPPSGLSVVALDAWLHRHGVRAVLHRARGKSEARLSFLISTRHTGQMIDELVDVLTTGIWGVMHTRRAEARS